jgi:hypothetical protein
MAVLFPNFSHGTAASSLAHETAGNGFCHYAAANRPTGWLISASIMGRQDIPVQDG